MGLGLAIVKSVMELHRGKVDVESAAGATTFTLHFPSAIVATARRNHHAIAVGQRAGSVL
jgi:two-component system heavy metal sensor histidine kinase CusS